MTAEQSKLFAAVYAAPLDDGPRARLADALQEAGDPRGDFISIQLARAKGMKIAKADSAREKALLKAHSKQWLEPLADVLTSSTVKWERGFPSAARLNLNGKWCRDMHKGEQPRVNPLEAVPELSTLRALKLGSPNSSVSTPVAEQLMQLPALRWLREVDDIPRRTMTTLLLSQPPRVLERITCRAQGGGGLEGEVQEKEDRLQMNAAFSKGALPALRELEMSWSHGADTPEAYSWLSTTSTGRQLKTLSIDCYYFARVLPLWHAVLTKFGDSIGLETLNFNHSWYLSIHRENGRWCKLTGDFSEDRYAFTGKELVETFQKLGRQTFTSIDIKGWTE